MKLIIGGYAQGKLHYVLQSCHLEEELVVDGKLPEQGKAASRKQKETVVINHFHRWVRSRIEVGECPEEMIRAYLAEQPDCIIICDEIGNGIVPADCLEREYRERLGRILTELAGKAEQVERVICGLGQRIK